MSKFIARYWRFRGQLRAENIPDTFPTPPSAALLFLKTLAGTVSLNEMTYWLDGVPQFGDALYYMRSIEWKGDAAWIFPDMQSDEAEISFAT